ncbi:hypothetical protein KPSA3_07151 [Pseudomonas syringae pv. actinidiae]|uniref:Uncharacterized protein n=1 Tax=Pseudomonas syringae pv. actinidiae TaxID=103796 RepID=A0AAN4QCJ9_PSESF|nr:hypothetical protein KPSA3_07151 [Pseudomonas syringae pv. actinidiae]
MWFSLSCRKSARYSLPVTPPVSSSRSRLLRISTRRLLARLSKSTQRWVMPPSRSTASPTAPGSSRSSQPVQRLIWPNCWTLQATKAPSAINRQAKKMPLIERNAVHLRIVD